MMRTTVRPRRTLAVSSAMALGLLAACSSEDPGGADESPSANTPAASGPDPETQRCTAKSVSYGKVDPSVNSQPVEGGELVVYSGRSEKLVGPLLKKFTEDTGIKVAVRYGDTGAVTAQILEEGDKTPADVFISQDAGALGAMANAGCLAKLPSATTQKVSSETYRAADNDWVSVTGRARTIIYNPDLIKESELPKSLAELTTPKNAERTAIAPTNASFQSFVTAIRVEDGDGAASGFLKKLNDGGVKKYDKNGDVVDAVNSGKVAMGLVNHYYLYETISEKGADKVKVKNHYPKDGGPLSLVNVSGAGVVSSTKKQKDALRLVDYMLSPSAQTYFAKETNEYPMTDGAPAPADAPKLTELNAPRIDLDKLDSLPRTVALINESGLV